jgi:LPXTG-motif cell wall-anchored protein
MSVRHSISRSVSILVASVPLAAGIWATAPAHADPYPPPAPDAAVNTTVVAPSGEFLISFTGFLGGEPVSMDMHSDPVHLTTATADADGNGSALVSAPPGFTGSHDVLLTGLTSGRVAVVVVDIVAPVAAGLPNTGVPAQSFGVLAGGLILSGLVLLGAARAFRRRRTG